MPPTSERRVRVSIRGRVQGVFFRQSTREQARLLGVRGWVTNRSDGTVEALLAGPQDAVARLLEWAHRGPDAARVDSVEVADARDAPIPFGFEIR